MTDTERDTLKAELRRELAQSGGKARQAYMTPEQRKEHARAMLTKRWANYRIRKQQLDARPLIAPATPQLPEPEDTRPAMHRANSARIIVLPAPTPDQP